MTRRSLDRCEHIFCAIVGPVAEAVSLDARRGAEDLASPRIARRAARVTQARSERRSKLCTPIRWCTTIFRAWTTTALHGAGGRRYTARSAFRRRRRPDWRGPARGVRAGRSALGSTTFRPERSSAGDACIWRGWNDRRPAARSRGEGASSTGCLERVPYGARALIGAWCRSAGWRSSRWRDSGCVRAVWVGGRARVFDAG